METVFCATYVPAELHDAFRRRCSDLKAATNPGTVWLKCLIELIGMASCPPTPPVTTDVLLRACWATEETLQVGLAPGRVPESKRALSIDVVAKLLSWHFKDEALQSWVFALLKRTALLPSGRIPVDLARRLCNRAVVFQGAARTDEDSDVLGGLLLRAAGLGRRGDTTIRKLWHDRDDHLHYAIEFRAWALLSGLASASGGHGEPLPKIAVVFDCNAWECAAAEKPDKHRNSVLRHLLRHFQSAKARLKCVPQKCLAATTVDAVMRCRRKEPDMVLLNGARLFLDEEHAVRGCVCSARQSSDLCGLPAWGGHGSSCSALVVRRCVQIDPRRTAGMWNPTTDMLNVLTPLLLKTVRTTGAPAKSRLITSVVARHTRLAVGVMAAAPFAAESEPSRQMLVTALKGRSEFWQSCVVDLPACSERLTTRMFAWSGPGPMHRLLEAAAAAGAFVPDDGVALEAAVKKYYKIQRLGIESVPIWATTAALAMLTTPCLGQTISSFHARSGVVDAQEQVMEAIVALENMLKHPDFATMALIGGFEGSWANPWTEAATEQRTLIKFMDRIRAPNVAAVLRREARFCTLRIGDRHAGWWHLGKAFRRAAVAFIIATTNRTPHTLPLEIALRVLCTAAQL